MCGEVGCSLCRHENLFKWVPLVSWEWSLTDSLPTHHHHLLLRHQESYLSIFSSPPKQAIFLVLILVWGMREDLLISIKSQDQDCWIMSHFLWVSCHLSLAFPLHILRWSDKHCSLSVSEKDGLQKEMNNTDIYPPFLARRQVMQDITHVKETIRLEKRVREE